MTSLLKFWRHQLISRSLVCLSTSPLIDMRRVKWKKNFLIKFWINKSLYKSRNKNSAWYKKKIIVTSPYTYLRIWRDSFRNAAVGGLWQQTTMGNLDSSCFKQRLSLSSLILTRPQSKVGKYVGKEGCLENAR